MVKRLFFVAGLTQYLGGDDVASGAAIHTALTRHPSILFQIDEFGDWLGEVLGANAAPYRKQIGQRLKTLYSEAGGVVAGTEYADQTKMGKPREDIINPHVCLYGTTTPGQFWRAIGSGSLEDGLMARFLVFISPESYPDECRPALIPIPSGLIEAFQAIAAGPDRQADKPAPAMASNIKPEPYTAPMTPAAQEAYRAMRAAQLAKQRTNEGSYVTSIAGRMAENAIKLALVRSISRDARRPVIDETDIAWGRALAEHCIDTILREASENVADTTYGRHVTKALQLVRRHGPISEAELFRRGWLVPTRDRTAILRDMVESGMVQASVSEGGYGRGRPTVWYSIPVA
ncbi:MAG: DUF3987 domain-containing protein, partial [Betaproteobacteria bacterium]|nr:DUF3987 domain-containing protein [Betaproteobacteria bacterium]